MTNTRRDFVMAAALAAPILRGQSKSGSTLPLVGDGDHKYEVVHDWGQLPPHIKWGNTHGVCEDSNGNVYVHHTVHKTSQSADSIVVFDSKGKFVRSWGPQYKDGAHGLHIRKEGSTEYLYICDQMHGIVTKRTLKGEEVWTLGYPSDSENYKLPNFQGNIPYRPTNVAIASSGDVYVSDGYGSYFVNQYDKNAKFIRTFGGNGKDPGKLVQPHGLMIDERTSPQTLLVADRGNSRIQRFSLDGKHIEFIEGTLLPCHFHARNGDVVVPDLQGRVTLLNKDNRVIAHLGDAEAKSLRDLIPLRLKERSEFIPGKFVCPHGAVFDHAGNIFVVEWVEVGRVTKLRKVA
jgi:hypothetical protein